QVLLLRVLEEVRDAVLDAVELLDRDLGVLDVLDRGRVLAHLLDEALGGGDGVADLVRDRRRQLVHAGLLLGLHRGALAAQLALGVPSEVARAPRGLAPEPLGPAAVPVVGPGHAATLPVLERPPEATVEVAEGTEGEAEHGVTRPASGRPLPSRSRPCVRQ